MASRNLWFCKASPRRNPTHPGPRPPPPPPRRHLQLLPHWHHPRLSRHPLPRRHHPRQSPPAARKSGPQLGGTILKALKLDLPSCPSVFFLWFKTTALKISPFMVSCLLCKEATQLQRRVEHHRRRRGSNGSIHEGCNETTQALQHVCNFHIHCDVGFW